MALEQMQLIASRVLPSGPCGVVASAALLAACPWLRYLEGHLEEAPRWETRLELPGEHVGPYGVVREVVRRFEPDR